VYKRFDNNLGSISLVQQWHRCIDLIQYEKWLLVLGDDDVLGENVVEEFYTFINQKNEKVCLIRFNLRIINENGQLQSDDFEHRDHESDTDLLARMFLMKETITASEFIFSRKVYEENNGFVDFPLAWFSDYATWLLFSKQTGVYHLKKASVYWRLSGINISSKSTTLRETDLKIKSLFLFISFLEQHFINYEIKQKKFAYIHLKNLLSNLTVLQSFKILIKFQFKQNYGLSREIITEFILKKIKEKSRKVYENICSTRKR
jgi:hypothetical protein